MDNLGSRLKALRIGSGLTLRELARRTSISPSFVSQVENGKSQPSVATLYSFANVLGVSVDELFESRREPGTTSRGSAGTEAAEDGFVSPAEAWHLSEYSNRISVVHPSHRPQLTMADGVVWARLAATPERSVNFMKIMYEPGSTSNSDGALVAHEGYEYGYVVEGELEVTVGDEVFTLREGESLGFDSSIPHGLRNTGADRMHGVWFVHGRCA